MRPLLGQTVIAVSRVALYTFDNRGVEQPVPGYAHGDESTAVFTLADGRRFELMEAQLADLGVVSFTEVPADSDLLTAGDLERTPDERAKLVPAEGMGEPLPWTVDSITEVWLPYQEPAFLIAVLLWSPATAPLLCIDTSADEISVRALDEIQWDLLRLPFICGSVLHHWYDVGHISATRISKPIVSHL